MSFRGRDREPSLAQQGSSSHRSGARRYERPVVASRVKPTDECLRIFGDPREEAVGRQLADTIIPPAYRDAHRNGLRRFLADGVGPVLGNRLTLTGLRRDGTEFPIEITISALREGDAWTFHAFVQDISERVAVERERVLRRFRLVG